MREQSLTTQLRVVFDGSMKSSSGLSINDIMLKGYTVQPDLFDILIRFRTFKYVIIADIQKMFRQIKINSNHTFLQNILWRDNPQDELKCIELQTVSYGTNSAPFLSTRCLKELAIHNKVAFPLASEALLQACYVDDILYGCHDIPTLFEAHKQLTQCLQSACISLHKWGSNSQEFLKSISLNSQQDNYVLNPENSSNKILGLIWNSHSDKFVISLPTISIKESYSKREVLSIIASIYDPIGLINPIVVRAKILMQKIWIAKIGWDESINSEILSEWTTFLENLSMLSKLEIPRTILQFHSNVVQYEIHGFCDASSQAYAACIYLRTLYADNSVTSHLITAKSRVAPLKILTIPKLELMGALLLSTLVSKLSNILPIHLRNVNSINLWSDSEIVLAWIRSHPSRWSVFVSNRIVQIQDNSKDATWRHIRSHLNPADILSRGSLPSQLLVSDLWWQGPDFLLKSNLDLTQFEFKKVIENLPEQRKTVHLVQKETGIYNLFTQFSDLFRLKRLMAYCLRFINNSKKASKKLIGSLSVSELISAENKIVQICQQKYFADEIENIQRGKILKNKALQKLNPFLDPSGLLRVGGRLSNANIPYNQKFPMLLPSKNHISTLILKSEHLRLLHAGPQNTLSNVRLKYWPLDGLREIKRIMNNCHTCYRFKPQFCTQLMGDLPKERLHVSRPFTNTSVDFGGPYSIKSSPLRRAPLLKCYIAVFVCMTTRAVHIELVSSLSTESFLLTLKRFIARRGIPSTVFSDNATNFLGAKNQLKELNEFFLRPETSESIQRYAVQNNIQWKFIPPRSPHHGGLWEAAIKSAKYHILRIMGNYIFTYEEFSTVLAQVEAVLNSRPICEMSNNSSDFTCLTPGHFLIGSSLTTYPEKDVTSTPINRLSLWKKCSQIQQQFWEHWKTDYLNRLQNRPKWFIPYKNIQVNDLVLLKDELTPPLKWPLARVIELIPGKDSLVRIVRVKTQGGTFTRAITKICPLPFCTENIDNQV